MLTSNLFNFVNFDQTQSQSGTFASSPPGSDGLICSVRSQHHRIGSIGGTRFWNRSPLLDSFTRHTTWYLSSPEGTVPLIATTGTIPGLTYIWGNPGSGSGPGSYPELLYLRSGKSSVMTCGLFDRRSRSPSVSFMLGSVLRPGPPRDPETETWGPAPKKTMASHSFRNALLLLF